MSDAIVKSADVVVVGKVTAVKPAGTELSDSGRGKVTIYEVHVLIQEIIKRRSGTGVLDVGGDMTCYYEQAISPKSPFGRHSDLLPNVGDVGKLAFSRIKGRYRPLQYVLPAY